MSLLQSRYAAKCDPIELRPKKNPAHCEVVPSGPGSVWRTHLVDKSAAKRLERVWQAKDTIMDDNDTKRQDNRAYRIGEELYGLSFYELEGRIAAYEAEIIRLRGELDKKAQEKLAADQLFGKN